MMGLEGGCCPYRQTDGQAGRQAGSRCTHKAMMAQALTFVSYKPPFNRMSGMLCLLVKVCYVKLKFKYLRIKGYIGSQSINKGLL